MEKENESIVGNLSPSSRSLVAPGGGGGKGEHRVLFALGSVQSCSLTASEQRPMEGMRFLSEPGTPPATGTTVASFALKKKKGDFGVGAEAKVPLPSSGTAEGMAEDEQSLNRDAVDFDPEDPDPLFSRIEEMQATACGRAHLQTLEAAAVAQPPWWLRRLTELKLFLNGTRVRRKSFSGVVDAAMSQLATDVDAAQALEQSVSIGSDGGFFCSPAKLIERIEEGETDEEGKGEGVVPTPMSPPEDEHAMTLKMGTKRRVVLDGGLLAHIVPPWLFVGCGQRMTHQLSLDLAARQEQLLDSMRSEVAKMRMKVLGISDSGGYDGTQSIFLFPAVQRLHASIMRKTVIMDLFASPMHVHRNRAQLISDGFQMQTPCIHADYITDKNAQPVYDSSMIHLPCLDEDSPLMDTRGTSAKCQSFVIHIDYIRFRPVETSLWSYASGIFKEDKSSSPSASSFWMKPLSNASFLNSFPVSTQVDVCDQQQHNCNDGPLVTFTQEDQLVSKILDNYEQYRMMKLNLLPQLKSREFYKDQLESLVRQPHPTEEQKQLKASVQRLFQLTCELESLYLKRMLSTWQQVARLRGENPDACFAPAPHSSSRPRASLKDDASVVDGPQASRRGTVEGMRLRRGFLGHADGGVVSLLGSDGPELPASSSPMTRFRMYFQRHGMNAAEVPPVQEEKLLDYRPVIEGLGVSAASPHGPTTEGSRLENGGGGSGLASQQQQQGQGREKGSPPFQPFATTVQDTRTPHFQVLVFARTNVIVPPQFVGCTTPRAMNTSKVLFFNETFELSTMQEPQEILLHILSVGGPDADDHVIATVSVPPSLTRAHLLLPLQSPISFLYRGRTYGKFGGGLLSGILSLSTTWTTVQGITPDEIENLFLCGEADPLDPQYEPLLTVLKTHYIELMRRNSATLPIKNNDNALRGGHKDVNAMTRHGGTNKYATQQPPSHLQGQLQRSASSEGGGILESKRLQLLHKRWLLQTNHGDPRNGVESKLFSKPIPMEDSECYELEKIAEWAALRRKREVKFEMRPHDNSLNDAETGSLHNVLTLSSLPRNRKLQLWHERLFRLKARRVSFRKLEDHELLERHVILPKLRPVKGIHLKPESQLNPRREERPKVDKIGREALLSKEDSRIAVHIMKATTLPQRSDGTQLEPFIEVSFICETVLSRSEVGTSPSWFETLNIPFFPPDFDDETLSLIDDDIVISVYDKVEIAMAPTSLSTGVVSHETHYRTERRLLGTLRVPFSTLYEADQGRIEGQFPLSTPRWILGYLPDRIDMITTMNSLRLRRGELTHSQPSIHLFIALWPALRRDERKELDQSAISRLLTQLNVSAQLQYLHETVMKWRLAALKKIKNLSSVNPVAHMREIEPFVFCTTGDLTLVCRFLLANGGPPPLTVKRVEEAIRFVSLLLFRIDTLTWGDKDVWSTNTELLRKQEGDYEELSLLLAHFLRFLAPEEVTFIVTGRGSIHNHVVMVLHSFGGELRLIDPRTGWVSPVHDPHIAFFRDIHMVISHDQIWANIQLSGAPHRMEWSLNDRRFWLPCFDHDDENVNACLPFMAALQREVLLFSMPDPQKEREIEQELRKTVRRALAGWRNNRQLAFHHGVSPILQTLLKDAESELCQHASVRRGTVTMRARELLNEYFGDEVLKDPSSRRRRRSAEYRSQFANDATWRNKTRHGLRIMGSPVNAAYRPRDPGYNSILQQVFETAVHEVGTNEVSFAIGVYVKGYTSEVYSMWVFLIALYEAVASPSA